MGIAYNVTQLSPNIGRTDEGYLVAKNCVLARTGFQKYQGRELPADELAALDLDVAPDSEVEVYRSPREVFSPATIASFEGKPVTDAHPSKFLGIENTPETYKVSDYQKGHVQNVRRGSEPLDSGDWPLLGDLIITDAQLIRKIDNGLRELSCGYGFRLDRNGDLLLQTKLTGNHVAVVRDGRAGPEVRVYDSAVNGHEDESSTAVVAVTGPTDTKPKKEYVVTNVLKHVFGLGLKAYAADAEPEKLTEAVGGLQSLASEEEAGKKAVPPPEQKLGGLETGKTLMAEDDSPRGRMHKLLDSLLDEREKKAADSANARDTDMGELKKLLGEFMGEESGEPEHTEEDAMPAALEEHQKEEEQGAPEDKEDEEKDGYDADPDFVPPVGEEEKKPVAASDALSILRELRPVVARSKDPLLRKWFNTRAAAANDAARRSAGRKAGGDGSYGEFHRAARTESSQARDSKREGAGIGSDAEDFAKLNDFYKKQANLEVRAGRKVVN